MSLQGVVAVHPDQWRPLLLVAVEGVEVLEALADVALLFHGEVANVGSAVAEGVAAFVKCCLTWEDNHIN